MRNEKRIQRFEMTRTGQAVMYFLVTVSTYSAAAALHYVMYLYVPAHKEAFDTYEWVYMAIFLMPIILITALGYQLIERYVENLEGRKRDET